MRYSPPQTGSDSNNEHDFAAERSSSSLPDPLTALSRITQEINHALEAMAAYGALHAVNDLEQIRWRLLSNACYGEDPNGDWQIEVFDGAEDDTGNLDAWRLRIYYGSHPAEI